MKIQCRANEQCSERDCLEVASIPNSAGDKQLEEVFFKLADIVGWSWTTDSLDAGHCIVCNGWLILSSFLEGKKTDMFFGKHLNTLRLLTGCMRLSHASSSLTHLTHS